MENEPLEIERKFLIRMPEEARLLRESARHIDITQTYLLTHGDGESRRLRRSRMAEGEKLYFTEKQRLSDLTRIEREREIESAEYEALLREADPRCRVIEKRRWCVPYAGHTLEIDVFPFWQDKAFCEVEMRSEDESVSLPEWIEVLREVTSDRRYTNRALAQELPE